MVVCTTYQVIDVLKECHDNLGSGGHAGRRRTTEKVSATYHGSTMREDVKNWVDESPRCQQHEVNAPVLHPIHVPEAWTALGVDLIGPLPSTAKGKRYILTATDLFTKWVVATTLYHKTAAEVSKKIVNILLDFGLVEKITTDQGREFVNAVHRGVFDALGRSTKCTPYVAQFGRHPRVPMYQNIQIAQQRQNISYEKRKGQNVKSFLINVGDEVLRANKRKEGNWFWPYVVSSITNKGVATPLGSTGAQLEPFVRPTVRAEPKLDSEGSVADHQYALSGAKYAKDLHPIQDKLLSYVHSTACLATLKALRGLLVTEASAKYSHRKRGIRAQETSRRLMSKNESKQDLCHLAKFKKSED
ncbi:hypothetical protein KUCAC02_021948 [Chaenocephalus aceratus]|nr:hypothetical protein KUCAC02_021948 [Chaenocephalus aceratus]